jgi:hypothetical protein
MRKPALFVFFLLLIPLFVSCRGTPAAKPGKRSPAVSAGGGPEDKPEGDSGTPPGIVSRDEPSSPVKEEEEDLPALFPVFEAAPGAGIFTQDPRDPALKLDAEERERISLSFRRAYAEALSRGLPLEGVLGGDRVHAWPADSPLAWVQNWKSAESYPNSWGLPGLVLAIRGIEAKEVFIVRGPILDAYGKSGGIGGANGVAGYGPPLSDEFPYDGENDSPDAARGIAQCFGKGLIKVDASGQAAFIPREPPASGERAGQETAFQAAEEDGETAGSQTPRRE